MILKEYTAASEADDDRMAVIRETISVMTDAEKRVFLNYVDDGLTRTARQFHSSRYLIRKYVARIIDRIQGEVASENAKRLLRAAANKMEMK